MEPGIKVLRTTTVTPRGKDFTIPADRKQLLSPTKQAILPPISHSSSSNELHPTSVFLQAASTELKDTMEHLLSEAKSAENCLQKGIESLWQRMLEMLETKTKELEEQLLETRKELTATKDALTRLSEREALLVQQSSKKTMELVMSEKELDNLRSEIGELKKTFLKRETAGNSKAKEEVQMLQVKHKAEVDGLQKTLDEKSKSLKEYQDKVVKMTEKMQKLSKQMTSEKTTSEQLHKSTSEQLLQKTSENRKMALEISKLKSQLTSNSSALAASRDEARKLELQLKSALKTADGTVDNLRKQHAAVVKSLEEKIAALQRVIEELTAKHHSEIASLHEKLQRTIAAAEYGEDHYCDARIKFLQHQNRQEKIKLKKELKMQQ